VEALQARGYVPMILLDTFEEAEWRDRFRDASRLGALDWAPLATVSGVRLYDVRGPS
jgi:hypothetical protein